jgi:hypothetical protein
MVTAEADWVIVTTDAAAAGSVIVTIDAAGADCVTVIVEAAEADCVTVIGEHIDRATGASPDELRWLGGEALCDTTMD